MEKVLARVENPSLVSETGLGFSRRAQWLKKPQRVIAFETEFDPGRKRP